MIKKYFFSASLLFIHSFSLLAQDVNGKIAELLNNSDFFELNRQLPPVDNNLDPMLYHLSKATLENAFNEAEAYCNTSTYVVNNFQSTIGLENVLNLLQMQRVHLIKQGRYKDALGMLENLLSDSIILANTSEDILTNMKIEGTRIKLFTKFPASEMIRPDKDCILPLLKKDTTHHQYIDAEINGKQDSFIFDTGADVSVFMSIDFAKKHGVEIFEDSIITNGLTHQAYTKLGFIKSLKIGDIEFSNIWATISPNAEILYKDTVVGKIDAVIGRHMMERIGEFHIYPKEHKIICPRYETDCPRDERNLILLEGQPFIEGDSNGEKIVFHFDTGAGIGLNMNYYQKHKSIIASVCEKDSVGFGGFGGAKRMMAYKLPQLSINIAGADCTLTNLDILTDHILVGNTGDGSLGFDFINMFDKVIVNFRQMFIKVENK